MVKVAERAGCELVEQVEMGRLYSQAAIRTRADAEPGKWAPSLDREKRTVDVIISTGARVRRFDFWSEREWDEELSLDPAHVDVRFLNAGAPVLDSHRGWEGTKSIRGHHVRAWIEGGQLIGTLHIRKGKEGDEILDGVEDGDIRFVSVGYAVREWLDVTPVDAKVRVLRAVDWEPLETSFVPIPADRNSKTRGEEQEQPRVLVPIYRQVSETPMTQPTGLKPTDEQKQRGQQEPAAPAAAGAREQETAPAPAGASPEDAAAKARAEERERCKAIRSLGERAQLDKEKIDRAIDEGISYSAFRELVFDHMVERQAAEGVVAGTRVTVGTTADQKVRSAVAEVISHRGDSKHQWSETARDMRGFSLLEMGRAYFEARGIRVGHLSRWELAGAMLGLSREFHGITDFPTLLGGRGARRLRDEYADAPFPFAPIVRETTVPDFRVSDRPRLADAPELADKTEHGEYTFATMDEENATIQLQEKGSVVGFTRRAVINDDLQSLDLVTAKQARRARELERRLIVALLTTPPTMEDGLPLFDNGHGNLSTGVFGSDGLKAADLKIGLQKDKNGSALNLEPKVVIVPRALKFAAQQLLSETIVPTKASDTNPWRGNITPIWDSLLDASSAVKYWLAADKSQIDIFELARLEGENGPRFEEDVSFMTDGIRFKVAYAVGVAAIDWRGIVQSSGAA